MNRLIKQVFKKAGVNAKITRDTENPKFKVTDGMLTLEGSVKDAVYSMKIKDIKGKTIDNISVSVKNTNDVVNRLSESLTTLHMLSETYSKNKLVEDDEDEFDDVVVDENEPQDLVSGLEALYDGIMDVANQAESLVDLADSSDAEQLSQIIGFSSALYDCAMDIDDYIVETTDIDEDDMDESVNRRVRTSRGYVDKAISNLTMCENLLRGSSNHKDILKAIKDIKSELIVRG
jgi:hypothetical protein